VKDSLAKHFAIDMKPTFPLLLTVLVLCLRKKQLTSVLVLQFAIIKLLLVVILVLSQCSFHLKKMVFTRHHLYFSQVVFTNLMIYAKMKIF